MNLQEQIYRINEMMGLIKENKWQSVEKLVEKFYNVDLKIESQRENILRMEIILTPKKDVVEEFGKIRLFSAWKRKSHLFQGDNWELLDVNSAYVGNQIFKSLDLQYPLNTWMLDKTEEFVKNM